MSDGEFAILQQLGEKRSHETAQAQVTVTPVDTVQHCSPCPLDPEMPSDVCMRLESNEGKMDPELKEIESSSAGTGLETPGQQCPPNEGTWETGRTTADGFLTAGVGSNQGGDISSPTTEHVDTRAVRTTADITFLQQGHKPRDEDKGSEENKQFDPGGKGETAPTVTLFFPGESVGQWEARWLCFVFFFCVCLSALFYNYCSFQVMTTFQRAEKHERRRGSSR